MRLTGEPTSFNGGRSVSHKKLSPRRDYRKWESISNVGDIDMKQIGEWLSDTINPMNSDEKTDRPSEYWGGSEFVLFSLDATNSTPYAGAVEFISKVVDSTPDLEDTITVLTALLADLGSECLPISPGLIIMNSIIHMFPSQAYLFNVIKEALELDGVKTIVFGQVHSAVLYQDSLVEGAVRLSRGTISREDIRSISEVQLDGLELLVNPAFFTSLPDRLPNMIAHIEIIPEETGDRDHLGPFRYTAVIHVTSEDTQLQYQQINQAEWVDFEQESDRLSLPTLLELSSTAEHVAITNIPYSRVVQGQRFLQMLKDDEEGEASVPSSWSMHARNAEKKHSLSIKDLVDIARYTGRHVEVSWALQSSQQGALSAVFYYSPPMDDRTRVLFRFPHESVQNSSLGMLCSRPMQRSMNEWAELELLEMLRTKISSYMVPRVIKTLDKMPINNNGKIDRRALASSVQKRTRQRGSKAEEKTLTEAEHQVCKIWAHTLRIEPATIGRNDRFFDIGGDSITAMRVVLETQKCNLLITVRDVFLLEVHEMAERMSLVSTSGVR